MSRSILASMSGPPEGNCTRDAALLKLPLHEGGLFNETSDNSGDFAFLGRTQGPCDQLGLVVAHFGARVRIVDAPLQWIVQQRKGSVRSKNSGWASVRFHRQRQPLLAYLTDRFPDATSSLDEIRAFPEWHP